MEPLEKWMPFLEARMELIKELRKSGSSVEEIEEKIGVSSMQCRLLVINADKEIKNG